MANPVTPDGTDTPNRKTVQINDLRIFAIDLEGEQTEWTDERIIEAFNFGDIDGEEIDGHLEVVE